MTSLGDLTDYPLLTTDSLDDKFDINELSVAICIVFIVRFITIS